MVKGPGTVILTGRSVLARRNSRSRNSTGCLRRIGPDDARHRLELAGRARRRPAGIVVVDALERRREAIGIALPAHLAVGDDVDAGLLLVADGEERRVVLRRFEKRLGHAPDLARADARRNERRELRAVNEPLGLRIGAHERRRQEPVQRPLLMRNRGRHRARPCLRAKCAGCARRATGCAFRGSRPRRDRPRHQFAP